VPVKPAEPQAVVIFGASGDLTKRKLLPAFYHLFLEGLLPDRFAIIGYARTEMTNEAFREEARTSVQEHSRAEVGGEGWDEFSQRLSYVAGVFDSSYAMQNLRDHRVEVDHTLGVECGRFFYCATPPTAYPSIVARIREMGIHRGSKIVIEKPFGRDLASAKELNERLHEVFDESQIFRIDHYLGKETVQNILAFRFANGMLEPVWNRRYIDNVQITVAEDIGIEGRGAFYEQTGTLRDVVQTHVFQALTFVAMEPPVAFEPDRLRDEKVRVLRSMKPVDPARVVRGQFVGYRQEEDVAPDSQAETYAALQVEIDNWRWAGVPFNLRTGKRLQRKVTEISLSFRHVPYNVFKGTDATPLGRDALIFRVQPNEGISLAMNVKRPGPGLDLDRASLDFDYDRAFDTPLLEAYETLLVEAMEGDHTLFTREDEVERAWEVLTPVLENPSPIEFYEPGSWGPRAADALILPRHWHLTPEDSTDRAEPGEATGPVA
jgi:glucose-6-phosphate 1-dehydrogenase